MQILTALPKVKTPIVRRKEELRPSRLLSEPLRRLHTTLQLAHEDGQAPRSILFVSADPGDGKSTVVAGLALVAREAGRRVAVVEADFRRPVMARLLGVPSQHGLAEVLAGTLPLNAVLQPVSDFGRPEVSAAPQAAGDGGVATVVESSQVGSLSVLPAGPGVANPPALLASPALGELMRSMSYEFDHVLVDAPPPLQVSDVLPLLTAVDGIVIVARAGHTRVNSATQLKHLLAQTPTAPLLGIVANSVSRADMSKYGFSSTYASRRWPRSLVR
jgi:polysaccharide biosynthesis transport protein